MEDEYQTEPVPDHANIAWWRIALMNSIFSISLPMFLGGLELVAVAPVQTFIWGTLFVLIVQTLFALAEFEPI